MAAVRQRQHVRLSRWIIGAVLAGCPSAVPHTTVPPPVSTVCSQALADPSWRCAARRLRALLGPAHAHGATAPTVVRNTGRYGPYYHMRLTLTAAMIDFAASDLQASSGGQFALRLHPAHFPVPAPRCRGTLILRMPWTAPDAPAAADKIAVKQELLARLRGLARDPHAAVPVVLELNPYVEVISRTPLRLQLTQCNVFFRHAFGGYVAHTGALQSR